MFCTLTTLDRLLRFFLVILVVVVFSILPFIGDVTFDGAEHDSPHQDVPEEIQEEQQEERCKDLVLHPPNQPPTLLGLPLPGISGDEIKLVPDAVQCCGRKIDAEVGPDDHEERKDDDGDIVEAHVVERLAEAEPGIGDVHAHKDGGADHGEVDQVRPTDQPQGYEVMSDQLVVVLARCFETQEHDERLLKPEAELEEVVKLEFAAHLPVWVLEPEMFEIVPPAVLEAHDVETQRGGAAPVEYGVTLFGKPCLFGLALDAPPLGKRFKDVERRRLTHKGKHDYVEDEEEEIVVSFLVSRFEALGGSRDEILQSALNAIFGR